MKTRVLDSRPVLEWINGRQPATDMVAELFAESEAGTARLFMSAINVGEVYYFLYKNYSKSPAESWKAASPTLPLTIEVPTAGDIFDAALLKAGHRIAYADAFAAALVQRDQCALVRGDPGFKSISDLKLECIGRDF